MTGRIALRALVATTVSFLLIDHGTVLRAQTELTAVDQIIATDDRRATVVVDLSTIGPVAARTAAERLSSVGITYCDGPVSGGVAGARAATIAFMFGGPTEVLDEHLPVFEVRQHGCARTAES